MKATIFPAIACVSFVLCSCSGPSEMSRPEPMTKTAYYLHGHQLFLTRDYDSAAVLLQQASRMDSQYVDPVRDLASLYYEQGMEQAEKSQARVDRFRRARTCFAKMESLGITDADVYERLCELSVALGDDRSFVKYARKNVEKYPFDRQYFNLGLACFAVGDYADVIRTQKEAVGKFKDSDYIGGFYRQLGKAYMKVDRDQTAEKTFEAGLESVNRRIGELKNAGGDSKSSAAITRLTDDRIAILLSLRQLHQTYKEAAKLERVERLLKEAGYAK